MLVFLLASDSKQPIQLREMTVFVVVVVLFCLLVFVLLEPLGCKQLRLGRKNLQVIPPRMFVKVWDSGESGMAHLGGAVEKGCSQYHHLPV